MGKDTVIGDGCGADSIPHADSNRTWIDAPLPRKRWEYLKTHWLGGHRRGQGADPHGPAPFSIYADARPIARRVSIFFELTTQYDRPGGLEPRCLQTEIVDSGAERLTAAAPSIPGHVVRAGTHHIVEQGAHQATAYIVEGQLGPHGGRNLEGDLRAAHYRGRARAGERGLGFTPRVANQTPLVKAHHGLSSPLSKRVETCSIVVDGVSKGR